MAPNKAEYDRLATEDTPEYIERLPFKPIQKPQHGPHWLIATLLTVIAALATTVIVLSTRPSKVAMSTASPHASYNSEGSSSSALHTVHSPSPSSSSSMSSPTQTALRQPCGTTAAEAEALNCHFDMIRLAWLPDACKDTPLLEEFNSKIAGIPIFWDAAGTEPLRQEDVPYVTQMIWSWRVFHKYHCAYGLMKMHRAIAAGRMLDSKMDLQHTRHCSLNLMNDTVPNEAIFTRVKKIIFPDCVPVGEMVQDLSEEF